MVSDGSEQVSAGTVKPSLCRAEVTPIGERGGAIEFEIGAGAELALYLEQVVD